MWERPPLLALEVLFAGEEARKFEARNISKEPVMLVEFDPC